MIAELHSLVALVEDRLADDLDEPALASELGTTEYLPSTDGESEALAFIARQRERLTTREGYVFAIADTSDNAVGHIGLFFRPGAGARQRWILDYAVTTTQRLCHGGARHTDDVDAEPRRARPNRTVR
jgi:hypothetical protein